MISSFEVLLTQANCLLDPSSLILGLGSLVFLASVFDKLASWLEGSASAPGRRKGLELAYARERVRELEEELIRLRSVFQKTAALNETLNFDRVLALVMDLTAAALAKSSVDDSRLVSAVLLFRDDQLYVAESRGLNQVDVRTVFPCRQGTLEATISTGRVQICEDLMSDPELKELTSVQNCAVMVLIPLVVGIDAYGLLMVGHQRRGYLSDEAIELLEAIVLQANVALQNARLYRQLEQEKERIGEIQEEARNKLARDLHDGPTQSIGAIAMRINFARRLVERDPKRAMDELFKIEELARRTTKEIRQMLFTLRPLILESRGLVPALQQLADKVNETHGQNVIVEAEPDAVQGIDLGKQGVVFFIVEEAVNNARKHAQANHVWVRLRREGELAYLEVADDGIGFDLELVQAGYQLRGSLGMVNLRERTELVNGVLQIDSTLGKGTQIAVTIPLTREAAELLHRPGFQA